MADVGFGTAATGTGTFVQQPSTTGLFGDTAFGTAKSMFGAFEGLSTARADTSGRPLGTRYRLALLSTHVADSYASLLIRIPIERRRCSRGKLS